MFQNWHCVSLRFISFGPRGIVISTSEPDLRLRMGSARAPAPFRAAPPSYSVKDTTGAELGNDDDPSPFLAFALPPPLAFALANA